MKRETYFKHLDDLVGQLQIWDEDLNYEDAATLLENYFFVGDFDDYAESLGYDKDDIDNLKDEIIFITLDLTN